MTLLDYVPIYGTMRDVRQSTIADYHWAARGLVADCGPVELDELTPLMLSQHLAHLQQQGYSPLTVHGRRGKLLVLWSGAYSDGYTENRPDHLRVRKIRKNRAIPRAWTPEQFERLLDAIPSVRGLASPGVRKAPWLRALCLVAISTGLRKGDLFSLERSFFLPGWSLSIVQSKTGDVHTARLGKRAIEAVEALPKTESKMLFPWAHRSDAFTRMFRRLLDRAGLPGSFKWCRRCGATWIAAKHGKAAASVYLGHRTPGLAELNYIDPDQLRPESFLPDGT